jgi:segregation and condensation protein B
MELSGRIEAVLFYKGEPVSLADLSRMVGASVEEVKAALEVLAASLSGRGVRLLIAGEQISLVTAPELSSQIETLRKEELKRDIGKAGAETLAIVLYKGPITRADIDYIRGVNSSFILRNLMMRGLVVRKEHEKDGRTFAYAASSELFEQLGITRREELPDYGTMLAKLDAFEKERTDEDVANVPTV